MTHDSGSTPRLDSLQTRLKDFVPTHEHDPYVIAAIEEAIAAVRQGNLGVGAVIVNPHGDIVQRGRSRIFQPTFRSDLHAEMDVMNGFEEQFKDATGLREFSLFTSLEPCPMCLARLITSGIGKGFHAAPDPNGGMVHRLQHMPPAFIELAAPQEFAQAACSPQLTDLAAQVFAVTEGIDMSTLIQRRT